MTLLPAIALAFTVPFAVSNTQANAGDQALEFAYESLGSSVAKLASVDLSEALAGNPWRFSFDFDGLAYSAWLTPTQVRAAGFRATASGSEGAWDCTAPALGTWRGPLDGIPGAQVAVGLGPDGLRVAVLGDPRGDWFVQPASSLGQSSAKGSSLHVAYRPASPFAGGDCGVADDAISHLSLIHI